MAELTMEAALQWAYGVELPRVNSSQSASLPTSWNLVANAINGFYSSGSVWTGGADPIVSQPHPDALVIHEAVVALRDTQPLVVDLDALLDGIAGFNLDPTQALEDARAKVGLDIIRHAKLKSRPDVREPPRARPIRYLNGSVQVVRPARIRQRRTGIVYDALTPVAALRKGVFERGSQCPIRWSPDPRHVLTDRAEHVAWTLALRRLMTQVSSRMSSLSLIRDDIDDTPWIVKMSSTRRAKRRIFHSILSERKLRDENVLKAAQSLALRGVARV